MNRVPPGSITSFLMVLALSQLFYALWPYRKRSYPTVLFLTLLGVLIGQGWDVLGLPALRLGGANLVPAVLFAAALQPLADRLPAIPIRFP